MSSKEYSGALAPKKKSELQEIAEKLSLDSSGTKEDIHTRIKAHLDTNDLSDDPVFGGLYPSKKKPTRKETSSSSLMPKSVTSDDEAPVKRKASMRGGGKRTTPPLITSPSDTTLALTTNTAPSSPVRALIANVDAAISKAIPDTQALVQAAEETGSRLTTRVRTTLHNSRDFLSNATNIASVTVLVELLFTLYVLIPWQYYKLPVENPASSQPVGIPYPPLAYLLSSHLWKNLSVWVIPTIIAPQVAGTLISFTTPRKDLDPLSAGIVKLALAVILDDSWFAVRGTTVSQWRIVGAATSLAFAMAEAVEERRVVMRGSTHT